MPDPLEPSPGDVAAEFCGTLLAAWSELGLSHAVICPGSRSTPLALAALRTPGLTCHIVHDERSGAFMALGIGLESGTPALVLSTSGTAAVHFHAAIVEADLAAVPMLVATADRPPELQGVFAPQTINQTNLYGQSVRWFAEPGVPVLSQASQWNDLAIRAHRATLGSVPGPVHLNLAFAEPLLGSAEVGGTVPTHPRVDAASSDADAAGTDSTRELEPVANLIDGRRGVILAGARTASDPTEAAGVLRLAGVLGWPVFADAQSGVRVPGPNVVTTFDLLLRDQQFADEHRPEVAIRFGGLLTSKTTYQWLGVEGLGVEGFGNEGLGTKGPGKPCVEQIGMDRFGRCPDPEHVLTMSLRCDPATAATQLIEMVSGTGDAGWMSSWSRAEFAARAAIEGALMGHGEVGEPGLAMDVMRLVPPGGDLVVSSSMPVRDIEWFARARSDVRVYSNRGANGIDGVTSTALGVATSSGRPTVLLTGDVAFLHDSAALTALVRRAVDLVVVVVHNDGGGIFSFLPQAAVLSDSEFETLFGTPHGTDVAALAAAHGLPTEQVWTRAGATAALSAALHQGGPRVVVARSTRENNVVVHERLYAAVSEALGRMR